MIALFDGVEIAEDTRPVAVEIGGCEFARWR